VELTCIVLEIMDHLMSQSETNIDKVLKGLSEYKKIRGLKYRFSVLIDTLRDSTNVILIEMILGFINNLIIIPSSKDK